MTGEKVQTYIQRGDSGCNCPEHLIPASAEDIWVLHPSGSVVHYLNGSPAVTIHPLSFLDVMEKVPSDEMRDDERAVRDLVKARLT